MHKENGEVTFSFTCDNGHKFTRTLPLQQIKAILDDFPDVEPPPE